MRNFGEKNFGDDTQLGFKGPEEAYNHFKKVMDEHTRRKRLKEAQIEVWVMSERGHTDADDPGSRDYYEKVCESDSIDFIAYMLNGIVSYFALKYEENSDAILEITPYSPGNPFMPENMEPPIEFEPIYRARIGRDENGNPELCPLTQEIKPSKQI